MEQGKSSTVWLAAHYVFATLYSCRSPVSSASSVLITPTPGPATVRLALIRNGIELYGFEQVRAELFSLICSAEIVIRPPERIAISAHNLHAYKNSENARLAVPHLNRSICYREYAHASGPMTIYIRVPVRHQGAVQSILRGIGYWGQAHSLAQCTQIDCANPVRLECAAPLRTFNVQAPVRHLVAGFVTEFRDSEVTWDEVVTGMNLVKKDVIRPELYVWPMKVCAQYANGRLLQRCSLGA